MTSLHGLFTDRFAGRAGGSQKKNAHVGRS